MVSKRVDDQKHNISKAFFGDKNTMLSKGRNVYVGVQSVSLFPFVFKKTLV